MGSLGLHGASAGCLKIWDEIALIAVNNIFQGLTGFMCYGTLLQPVKLAVM